MTEPYDDITRFLALTIVAELAVVSVAVAYILAIWWRSPRTSRTFRMLAWTDVVKLFAGGFVGLVAALVYQSNRPVPMEWRPYIEIAIIVLFAPPIVHAYTFWRLRRERRDGTPPPILND